MPQPNFFFFRKSTLTHHFLFAAGAAITAIVLVTLAPVSCFASLGGDAASVLADQSQFRGTAQIKQMQLFAVNEIHLQNGDANGTMIREYVSGAGKVFAVTWQGPVPPNMRQLLGPYFQQFTAAVQAEALNSRARRPLNIVLPELGIQLNGHMRSFSGKVYLPQMLPAGVRAEDIQ